MIIPWSTDAPIYHFPFATIGLIAVNTGIHLALMAASGSMEFDPPMVHFGVGLRPWEWLGANFLHGNLSHLLGNMFFLWAFGLVVEGKVGWWRFLLIYLAIGVFGYALVQVAMLRTEVGGALGASLPIFGLLAIAMLWAPKNEINFVGWVFIRPVSFDATILGVATFYLTMQVVFFFLSGQRMSSEYLHLVGALFGFPIGFVMLHKQWVDCENWDLLSLLEDRLGKPRQEQELVEPELLVSGVPQAHEAKLAEAREHMRRMLQAGHAAAAAKFHVKMQGSLPGWGLSQRDLVRLIEILHERQAWEDSIPVMREFLQRYPEQGARVRLRAAQILIDKLHRPGQALRVLGRLPTEGLHPKLADARAQLMAKAQRLREHAPLELEAEDW